MAESGVYDHLTLDELRVLAAAIDRESQPERAAELDAAIGRKEAKLAAGEDPDSADSEYASLQQAESDNLATPEEESRLASRGERFAAAIIDTLVSILVTIPLFLAVGLESFDDPTFGIMAASFIYGITAYVVVHGYLLLNYGQTVGKRFLNIRIEDMHGQQATFSTILLKRVIPFSLVVYIPIFGSFFSLVDILFIFRSDKRCIHDHVAGTQVCRVPESLKV